MFSKILIPVGFSGLAEEAIDIGIDIGKKYNSKIYLLTVSEILNVGYGELVLPEEIFEKHKKIILENLNNIADKFQKEGLEVELNVREGIVYEEIVEFAKEKKIGLIIMATHGRKGLEKFLMGSVSQKVVKLAHCPVLTFNPKFKEEFIDE